MKTKAENDSRFVCIYNDENMGASGTRNKALSMIDGEFVTFCDADDWWEPNLLEKMTDAAFKYGADIVQCRYMHNYANGNSYTPSGVYLSEQVILKKDFKKIFKKIATGINMNHVCMKLIKTNILGDLRFDPALPTAEDLVFCIMLFKSAKTYVFIPDVLYHYYRSEDSLTGSGLPFKKRLDANRKASRVLVSNAAGFGADRLWLKALGMMRPYIITVSKIIRIMRDGILRKRGNS